MALELKVPGMNGSDAAQTITEVIKTAEPAAQVNVDLDAKTVTVVSQASEETIKQLITASGYTIA
jgi:copper chaperone